MSFEQITPNMNLVVPSVGLTIGPTWASDINASMAIIDQHTHSPGSGVQITPAGINISSDLAFNGNNAISLRSSVYQSQSSALSGASDLDCVYVVNGDMYYNDGVGNQVRITQSGGVAGSPGSISGLVSPASASYVSGTSTFVWQSNVNTAANMDAGSLILRNITANSPGVTLSPPNALGSDYDIVLPQLPLVQSFVTLDSFGNMAAPWTVDGVSIQVVSNQLKVNQAALTGNYQQRTFTANGTYGVKTAPLTAIDGLLYFNTDATILAVWIGSGVAGSSGTTEYDLKLASPSGSFASILSTTGKITSAAAAQIWTDSNSVVGAQTGVTKPVVTTTSVNAGQALRFDLLSVMVDGEDASITVQYISR